MGFDTKAAPSGNSSAKAGASLASPELGNRVDSRGARTTSATPGSAGRSSASDRQCVVSRLRDKAASEKKNLLAKRSKNPLVSKKSSLERRAALEEPASAGCGAGDLALGRSGARRERTSTPAVGQGPSPGPVATSPPPPPAARRASAAPPPIPSTAPARHNVANRTSIPPPTPRTRSSLPRFRMPASVPPPIPVTRSTTPPLHPPPAPDPYSGLLEDGAEAPERGPATVMPLSSGRPGLMPASLGSIRALLHAAVALGGSLPTTDTLKSRIKSRPSFNEMKSFVLANKRIAGGAAAGVALLCVATGVAISSSDEENPAKGPEPGAAAAAVGGPETAPAGEASPNSVVAAAAPVAETVSIEEPALSRPPAPAPTADESPPRSEAPAEPTSTASRSVGDGIEAAEGGSERPSRSTKRRSSTADVPRAGNSKAGGSSRYNALFGGSGNQKLPIRLSREAIQTGMNSVARQVKKCARRETRPIVMSVTIGKDGRVSHAVASGSFTGTDVGSCVARVVRTASFPPAQQGITVKYPFHL